MDGSFRRLSGHHDMYVCMQELAQGKSQAENKLAQVEKELTEIKATATSSSSASSSSSAESEAQIKVGR